MSYGWLAPGEAPCIALVLLVLSLTPDGRQDDSPLFL